MKATTKFRLCGLPAFLLYLVFPSVLHSQGVTIRERMEINPSPPVIQASVGGGSHHIAIEATWDKQVDGNVLMRRDFGAYDLCGEEIVASGKGQASADIPLSAGYFQFSFFICVAQLGQYETCTGSCTIKIDDQVIGTMSGTVAGGSYTIIWEKIGTVNYSSPYPSVFTFSLSRKSMFYEEGTPMFISTTEDCRLGTFDPAADVIQLEIIAGTSHAQFYNYRTRQMAGTSLSGLISALGSYSFVANGKMPPPAGADVTVRASCGLQTYTETIKILPYYFRVTADTPRVYVGGATPIKIVTIDGSGNYYNRPASPYVSIKLAANADYGTLWYGIINWGPLQEADTVEPVQSMYLNDPSSGLEVDFLANERQPKDSITVRIDVEKIGEGSSPNNWPPWGWPRQGLDTVRGSGEVTVIRKEQEFAGFKIELTRDTIKNRETSTITIIAIDKDSNEVEIDAETAIHLSFKDLQQYVDFISATGDTLDALTNVPYSILRAGQVKIIARGTQAGPVITAALTRIRTKVNSRSTMSVASPGYSNTYPKIGILAEASSDLTKQGYRDFFIMPEVKVIAVADSIKPYYPGTRSHPRPFIDTTESRTDVKVVATVSGILFNSPLQYRVEIASFAVNGSGGHSLAHSGIRPTGVFVEGTDTVTVLNKQTTGDTIRARYQSSFFGGKEKIVAKLIDLTPAITDTDSVVVRIQNLVPLQSRANNLITYTSPSSGRLHHLDSSDYGKRSVCDSIVSAVRGYANELGLENDIFLAAIDMSLPLGGKFEIDGNWESESGPHDYHRLGISVDFSYKYRNITGIIIDVDYFEDNELIKTTDQIDEDKLDNHFSRRGFDRWERRIHKIHYESRN